MKKQKEKNYVIFFTNFFAISRPGNVLPILHPNTLNANVASPGLPGGGEELQAGAPASRQCPRAGVASPALVP